MLFKDKVVWITGASSGIGAELARQLAGKGAKLILTARNAAALQDVAASCKTAAYVLQADLTSPELLHDLSAKAIAVFGHIDGIIHSAGVSQRSLAGETEEAVYRQLMEINFFAPVFLTKSLLPHFRSRGGGQIVAISSMAGLMGFPMRTGYSAAKHALKGYFETLQTEHDIPGLEILLVYPGRIHTPISLAALTGDGTPHHEMDAGQAAGIPVAECAGKVIRAMEQKKRRVIIARGERVLWWLWFFLPSLYYRIARKKGGRKSE